MSSWGESWGVSWGDSWGSIGEGIEANVDLLLSVSDALGVSLDLETAFLASTLVSETVLKAYQEIQLGTGNVITLGFINGIHVRILPIKPPWAPETDPLVGSTEVDTDLDVPELSSETTLFTPQSEVGPILATLEIGSTALPVAVYGDAIYTYALGSASTPLYPSIDARKTLEYVPDAIGASSALLEPLVYPWLRNDVDTVSGESALLVPTVDTDCAVNLEVIPSESYGFMCLIQEGLGVDLQSIGSESTLETPVIETEP